PPPFEQPSVTAAPITGDTPRAPVPGGSYFGGGSDVFIPPTIGQLTAPASASPAEPAKPAAAPGEAWRGPPTGPPAWLRQAPPAAQPRVDGGPPVTRPSSETEAARVRLNNDRSMEFRILGRPKIR